jgi:hypothetical protein
MKRILNSRFQGEKMRMSRYKSSKPVLCLFLTVAVFDVVSIFAQGPDLEKVLIDWRVRQEKSTSAHYQMKGARTIPKGQISKGMDPEFPEGQIIPSTDITLQIQRKFVLDFDNHRLVQEKRYFIFRNDELKFVPWYSLSLFDGDVLREFEPTEKLTSPDYSPDPLRVEVRKIKVNVNDLLLDREQFPIFFAHGLVPSGSQASLILKKENFPITHDQFFVDRTQLLGDIPCIIVKSKVAENGIQFEYWVDPSRKSAIIKSIIYRNLKPLIQIENIEHKMTEWGWVPETWVCNYVVDSGREIESSEKLVVTAVSINQSFSKSDFQGQYSQGMIVQDLGTNQYYRVDSEGQLKKVTRKELIDDKPPILWWRYGVLVLVCVFSGILLWRFFSFRSKKHQV